MPTMKSNHGSNGSSGSLLCSTWKPKLLSKEGLRRGWGSPSSRPMNRFRAPNIVLAVYLFENEINGGLYGSCKILGVNRWSRCTLQTMQTCLSKCHLHRRHQLRLNSCSFDSSHDSLITGKCNKPFTKSFCYGSRH